MHVILLGPPGVGKGTQGVLLAEGRVWERLVTGDLLRQARAEGTLLGQEAQRFMDAGELVPDNVVIGMVREKLTAKPAGARVVFDGFPRTSAQASGLSLMLGELGMKIDQVVVLEAEDEPLVQRIAGRRSCPRCGAAYNVFLAPPAEEGVCNIDGFALQHRRDDQPETVQHRLDVYRDQTAPVIDYYEASGARVHHVDGDQSVEGVQAAVVAALGVG
jgi:adenylate kinase